MHAAIRCSLALLATLAAAPHAGAQPTLCQGRYTIDGGLDLGGDVGVVQTVTAGRRISLDGGNDAFVVTMGGCSAAVVTQAPRTDLFVLRSKFRDCGARPRFRLRLAFASDCQTVSVRRRSGGRLIDDLSAQLVVRGPRQPIGGRPVGGRPGRNPRDPGAPTPPADPSTPTPVDPNTTPIGTKPTISVIQPAVAHAGDRVSIFGRNLDRDVNGAPWNGTPPFLAVFSGSFFGGHRNVDVTFRSATELEVTVPARAQTGTIQLVARNANGSAGATIGETAEPLVVVTQDAPPPPAPVAGTPPATTNTATLTVQGTALNAIQPGTYPLAGAQNQAGAFLDSNHNFFVDLADPTGAVRNVPYLAFPVRTSDIDFSIAPGSGYFAGANGMLWFILGDVTPGAPGGEIFVTVHLNVDVAAGTAQPIAMIAGVVQQPGIIVSTDASGFSVSDVHVESPVIGGPGAIRGHLAGVGSFLQNIFLPSEPALCLDPDSFCPDFGPSIQQNLWANGVDVTFDLPLFNDN
jgi:hypothetical protein